MLPTHGLFRSIPCPYYVSGLCERPHCLFRHTKSDVLLARQADICATSDGEEEAEPARETINQQGGGRDKLVQVSRGVKRKAEDQAINENEGKSHCGEVIWIKGEAGGVGKSIHLPDKTAENKSRSSSGREGKESSKSSSRDHRHKSSSSSSSSSKRSSKSSSDNSKVQDKKSSSSSRDKEDSNNHHRSHSSSSKSKSSDKSHKSSSSKSNSNNNKSSSSHKSSRSSSSSSKDKSKSKTLSESRSRKSDSNDTIIKKESSSVTTVPDDDDDVRILDSSKAEDLELSSNAIYEDEENFNLPQISDSEDDPDDIELECLRLFQDYQPEAKSPEKKIVVGNPALALQSDPGRKRQAHPGASEKKATLPPSVRKSTFNLHEQIARRLESQKKVVNSRIEETKKIIPSSSFVQKATHQTMSGTQSLSSGPSTVGNKKRIAHVPNVSGLLKSPSIPVDNKTPLKSSGSTSTSSSYSTASITLSRTSDKGVPRVAHSTIIYATNKNKGPLVNIDAPAKGIGKIPVLSRQKVLDQLFEAAMLVHDNQSDAFQRAIDEEATIQVRSKTKAVYTSLAVSKVRTIRKEAEDQHNQLNQEGQSSTSPGAKRDKDPSIRPTGQSLYQGLKNVVLKEEDLVANGFPRSHPNGEPGCAVATLGLWNTEYVSEQTRRTCDRCHKVFNVDETGIQAANEGSCVYHSGKKTSQQVNRAWKVIFSCCGDERGSSGCSTATFHVPKSHPVASTRGFVSAVQSMGSDETMGTNRWDVVAIDCEMVYTTGGSELARATFLDKDGEVIYDELVKPQHPVLDYNTKYSGLTESIMEGVTNTLNSVQAVLLTQLKPNSILIGHSLESDLIALRVKHDYVVDTSLLYPHRRGLPYKKALKMLSQEHLRKLIQESVDGHDSAEDARAALDLAVLYVQQNTQCH
ncbi:RNA exonuclease 1 homolog isoform X2 [Folsomia candida]|uniref:RNA exonuclease 1 homolog isoform X2 n=1 Tax=Folsomia candida TaxID=158441 RepID=UPI000B8FE56F|nr:RNA exonuclease 1 homolog isoform X2 [Folsomia candida]